ncbi:MULTISPECIES: MBL fold metallo-hydrolase [unclassified Terrabacter]|uniref:MBL fold metallo-hydrolase RNA specificity domain-containing protein n=1 Tax=unclassified Terrabacter TaxID=2630222 RepID=UPI0006FE8CB5|nr:MULTISPECIES: MBL fold metallo-hydrolase [unclassified Terrabacter]KRB47403.1 MBL fold metallo-hydrolase [Terrabacter sp. Root181]KRF35692.1 MBL fold metallo-hydrolase [Terrabacter sp. Soil810]
MSTHVRPERHGPAPALTFLGAAGTVTGSKFLVEGEGARLMVDCGLYQGERRWRSLNWEAPPVDPASVDAVALTHAHLDHCGYLPALVRGGFAGPVHATAGTAALAGVILRDSAHLQEEEAEGARRGGWSRHDPPLPLYTVADADEAVAALRPVGDDAAVRVGGAAGATVTFVPAGHILGSSSVLVEIDGASVLFSGDLGRPDHPVLLPRARPPAARTVVVESTYGDRAHPEIDRGHRVMADAIRRTVRRGGSVVVPAFAVDRTEIVLLAIADLVESGAIPDVPVWVDSPMALAALDIYRDPAHAGEVRPDALERLRRLSGLRTAHSAEESIRLNTPGTPCIIVSASGMATGGRVVHHLRHLLPQARNTVLLTGYQAVGTRGRDLQEGARELKMAGRYVPVRAEVVTLDDFSVHADADELLTWIGEMPHPPESVHVVHGEPGAARALADGIRERFDCAVSVPRLGERVLLD